MGYGPEGRWLIGLKSLSFISVSAGACLCFMDCGPEVLCVYLAFSIENWFLTSKLAFLLSLALPRSHWVCPAFQRK